MHIEDPIPRQEMPFEEKVVLVRQRITDAIESGDGDRERFTLNNFYTKLPGSWVRSFAQEFLDDVVVERYQGLSPRAFYEEVDSVVEELNISMDLIEELQAKFVATGSHDPVRELTLLCVPVYVKLREMGYSHQDLWT